MYETDIQLSAMFSFCNICNNKFCSFNSKKKICFNKFQLQKRVKQETERYWIEDLND